MLPRAEPRDDLHRTLDRTGLLRALTKLLDALAKLDLSPAVQPAHDLAEFWAPHQLPSIDTHSCGDEPAATIQKLVGELYHSRVRPSLRPVLQQSLSKFILPFVRTSLSQDHQSGGRRARNSSMAMDQQAPRFGCVPAKSQDRLDIRPLRQQYVRGGLDRIVKAQRSPKVWIERLERFWLRPFRVQNRQNMRDAPALVADDFIKSTNGECWEG